jgi:hypothetical protein
VHSVAACGKIIRAEAGGDCAQFSDGTPRPKAERVRSTAGCGTGGEGHEQRTGGKRMDLAPADADARQRGCVTGETGSV